jgi:hypothetical protein
VKATVAFGVLLLTASGLWAEDLKGQNEIMAFGGVRREPTDTGGDSHNVAGASFGHGVGKKAILYGEVRYAFVPDDTFGLASGIETVSTRWFDYRIGLRYSLPSIKKVEPYFVIAAGADTLHQSASTATAVLGSDTFKGPAVDGGLGARIYLGKKWGVAPEVRYVRYIQIHSNLGTGLKGNDMNYLANNFFHFGK